jgi:hypothetical protein
MITRDVGQRLLHLPPLQARASEFIQPGTRIQHLKDKGFNILRYRNQHLKIEDSIP